MNLDNIRAELEFDLTWRQNELRSLRNQLAYISSEQEKKRYRKSLIVMLYSHYEGFCKTAFSIYADAINKTKIKCCNAHQCIVAASLADVFRDYENTFKKSAIFVNILPDDSQLHRYARQVELIENLDNIWAKEVNIPTDTVIDTGDNLTPFVLRKLLYRLGFPHDIFQSNEGKIHLLLNQRNQIAHGVKKDGYTQDEYNNIEIVVHDIMNDIIKLIYSALKSESYMNTN